MDGSALDRLVYSRLIRMERRCVSIVLWMSDAVLVMVLRFGANGDSQLRRKLRGRQLQRHQESRPARCTFVALGQPHGLPHERLVRVRTITCCILRDGRGRLRLLRSPPNPDWHSVGPGIITIGGVLDHELQLLRLARTPLYSVVAVGTLREEKHTEERS